MKASEAQSIAFLFFKCTLKLKCHSVNIKIKTPEAIEKMRLAGLDTAKVLDFIAPFVKPGITTGKLNDLCHDYMVNTLKVIPAPLHYQPTGYTAYPKSICTSVNHQVCHGIPGDRKLSDGDIVNIDITVIRDGYHGDASRMYGVGKVGVAAMKLMTVTQECLWLGIHQVKAGARLSVIGEVIEAHAKKFGYSVVRDFCGHGIGTEFHEDPQVLHYKHKGDSPILQAGMIFTIEPMINAGKAEVKEMADGWTIVTRDHSLSAQWEHTILVTEAGYEVLTLSPHYAEPPSTLRG